MAEVRQDTKPAALRVPDPQFPTEIPAGRRSSTPTPPPAPGGQPDPNPQTGNSSIGPLRLACVLGATSLMPARSSRGGNP